MDLQTYQNLAMVTNGTKKKDEMLINACLGLSGETGEFCEHIKKSVFHGHKLELEYLKKELGDILWYVAQGATAIGVSLNDIAAMNIAKLKTRYPEGFTRSVAREQKA